MTEIDWDEICFPFSGKNMEPEIAWAKRAFEVACQRHLNNPGFTHANRSITSKGQIFNHIKGYMSEQLVKRLLREANVQVTQSALQGYLRKVLPPNTHDADLLVNDKLYIEIQQGTGFIKKAKYTHLYKQSPNSIVLTHDLNNYTFSLYLVKDLVSLPTIEHTYSQGDTHLGLYLEHQNLTWEQVLEQIKGMI